MQAASRAKDKRIRIEYAPVLLGFRYACIGQMSCERSTLFWRIDLGLSGCEDDCSRVQGYECRSSVGVVVMAVSDRGMDEGTIRLRSVDRNGFRAISLGRVKWVLCSMCERYHAVIYVRSEEPIGILFAEKTPLEEWMG